MQDIIQMYACCRRSPTESHSYVSSELAWKPGSGGISSVSHSHNFHQSPRLKTSYRRLTRKFRNRRATLIKRKRRAHRSPSEHKFACKARRSSVEHRKRGCSLKKTYLQEYYICSKKILSSFIKHVNSIWKSEAGHLFKKQEQKNSVN